MRNPGTQESSQASNPEMLGYVTMAGGLALGLYALGNAWATLTSHEVLVKISARNVDAVTTAPWAPGGHIIAPHVVAAPANAVPTAARWMLQLGNSLAPVLWAAAVLALGLVLVRVGGSVSAFSPPVRRALNTLIGLLTAIALVPTGLVLFGTNMALGHLGWPASTYTALGTIWLPLLASYLATGFRATLAHGATLADELDQVI